MTSSTLSPWKILILTLILSAFGCLVLTLVVSTQKVQFIGLGINDALMKKMEILLLHRYKYGHNMIGSSLRGTRRILEELTEIQDSTAKWPAERWALVDTVRFDAAEICGRLGRLHGILPFG